MSQSNIYKLNKKKAEEIYAAALLEVANSVAESSEYSESDDTAEDNYSTELDNNIDDGSEDGSEPIDNTGAIPNNYNETDFDLPGFLGKLMNFLKPILRYF
jgi:hypothetical protein